MILFINHKIELFLIVYDGHISW